MATNWTVKNGDSLVSWIGGGSGRFHCCCYCSYQEDTGIKVHIVSTSSQWLTLFDTTTLILYLLCTHVCATPDGLRRFAQFRGIHHLELVENPDVMGISIIIYWCQPLIHKPCGAEFRGTIWFLGTPVIAQPEWTFIRGWHYSTLLTIQPSTYWTTQWIYHSNTESLTSKSDHFHNIHHEIQLVWLCVNTYQTILRKMNIINPSQRTSVITQGIPWCFDP